MFGLVWSRSCVFICNFQERRSAGIYYVRLDLEADSYNKPSKLKMAKKFITYCFEESMIIFLFTREHAQSGGYLRNIFILQLNCKVRAIQVPSLDLLDMFPEAFKLIQFLF